MDNNLFSCTWGINIYFSSMLYFFHFINGAHCTINIYNFNEVKFINLIFSVSVNKIWLTLRWWKRYVSINFSYRSSIILPFSLNYKIINLCSVERSKIFVFYWYINYQKHFLKDFFIVQNWKGSFVIWICISVLFSSFWPICKDCTNIIYTFLLQ